ncbi:MAG: hypothetical protein AB7I01_05165 [Gammaproteobacteria bacterium]
MSDHYFETYTGRAHGLITIGHVLRELLELLNRQVQVIPNFRYAERLVRNDALRGLEIGDRLMTSRSTISAGFEFGPEVFSHLSAQVHFDVAGISAPSACRIACLDLAARLGVGNRLLCDQVP